MKIKRVGKHAIRCILSAEEMWESGMQVDDFIQDKDKTEEFIRDIVEKAHDEIGFECTGEAFSVQISLLADSSVVLMISNEDPNILQFLSQLKDRLAGLASGEAIPGPVPVPQENVKPIPVPEDKGKDAKNMSLHHAVIVLDSLEDAGAVAKRISGMFEMKSTLYKHKGAYYLTLDLALTVDDPEKIQPCVIEYYLGGTNDDAAIAHVREFGKTIIAENAVEVLAAL